jgi:hypothetical protein
MSCTCFSSSSPIHTFTNRPPSTLSTRSRYPALLPTGSIHPATATAAAVPLHPRAIRIRTRQTRNTRVVPCQDVFVAPCAVAGDPVGPPLRAPAKARKSPRRQRLTPTCPRLMVPTRQATVLAKKWVKMVTATNRSDTSAIASTNPRITAIANVAMTSSLSQRNPARHRAPLRNGAATGLAVSILPWR